MKVSLNIIREFTKINITIDELVTRINNQLGGVEEVIDYPAKYKDATIVRVVEFQKHPDADRLFICKVDVGKSKMVQVVCGAPNVHSDMWAVWLPPGSIVPATSEDKSPFVLDIREIRGVQSQGMLAAADELGIGSDHRGIMELTNQDISPDSDLNKLQPGMSFSKVFGLDQVAIDIENKMFTHRPDLFGQLGVAREIAGIQQTTFNSPKWYKKSKLDNFPEEKKIDLKVLNHDYGKTPRFMVVGYSRVEVKPSPMWLQCALVVMGAKPINNIVDATNYVMLMTGQPTHAYDYDKLKGHEIGVRLAKKGEKLKLLNNKTYQLEVDDLVVVDREGPIGLAGVMGGKDSEVSISTKRIVLECANFDMYSVRRTSMRHGIFTDAVTRFNKGPSPLQNDIALGYLQQILAIVSSSRQSSDIFDLHQDLIRNEIIDIKPEFVNQRLGLGLSEAQIVGLLENVEFEPIDQKEASLKSVSLKIPFWRTDISIPEDIVEEVGRLYGFEALPHSLPIRSIAPPITNLSFSLKKDIRQILKSLGANEVLTYSFVHEKVIKKADQDQSHAFVLGNALNPDLKFYRLSVLPSLLDKVHANIKSGYGEFFIYEIGKGHNKRFDSSRDGLPGEQAYLDGVYSSKNLDGCSPYYIVRQYVSQLTRKLGFDVRFNKVNREMAQASAPFDLSRSALVIGPDGQKLGIIGELKHSVVEGFKLPISTAAISLDFESLLDCYTNTSTKYSPLSRYPSISQDLSLKVKHDTPYSDVLNIVESVVVKQYAEAICKISPLSIYQSNEDKEHKTITLRLQISPQKRTLTESGVNDTLIKVVEAAKDVGATRV